MGALGGAILSRLDAHLHMVVDLGEEAHDDVKSLRLSLRRIEPQHGD